MELKKLENGDIQIIIKASEVAKEPKLSTTGKTFGLYHRKEVKKLNGLETCFKVDIYRRTGNEIEEL